MTIATDVYYDPYDVAINADPYPVYRRLREEAPLYYNDVHDFYAVSRFDDVEKGLLDAQTFISGRGAILELIKANVEMPKGILIFEDPPTHTIHRRLLSRAFSPRRVAELEPQIREFCVRCLDPLVGADRFDFIADIGAEMPMRVIGMLLGIPEADQKAVKEHVDASLRTKEGEPMTGPRKLRHRRHVRRLRRVARRTPLRRHHDRAAQRRIHRRDRHRAHADPRRAPDLPRGGRWSGQRDDDAPDRLGGQASVRAPRSASPAGGGPFADPERDRGDPPLRTSRPTRRTVCHPGGRGVLRREGPGREARSSSLSARPTGTIAGFRTATASTSVATTAAISPSATASTSASVRRWHGWKGVIALEEILTRFPDWEVDLEHARLSPTSTVRGFETLPARIG